jgi:hypothetical protein
MELLLLIMLHIHHVGSCTVRLFVILGLIFSVVLCYSTLWNLYNIHNVPYLCTVMSFLSCLVSRKAAYTTLFWNSRIHVLLESWGLFCLVL